MGAAAVAQTIQLILAPVVMVTACAIIVSGMMAHYAAINDRLRLMARERVEQLRAMGHEAGGDSPADSPYAAERLREIDAQVPMLLRHHRTVRDAAVAVYAAMSIFVASMIVIAVAALAEAVVASQAALLMFLAGTGALLIGVVLAVLEIRTSHRALHYEVDRVLALGK